MRVIVAGSRTINDIAEIEKAIAAAGFEITSVISGCARGADISGEIWASRNLIPCERFPADWDAWGKAAGHIRNQKMADYGHALIAVWDGKSRGTANMIAQMKRRGKPVYIHLVGVANAP